MAGFYGNVSTSNKTVFSFDRIYNSRWQMEQSCDTDDIFLNRYVLVEYDDPPLVGYLVVRLEQTPQGELYVQHWYADGTSQTELQVDTTKIYQNLTDINTDHSFYRYEIRKNENDADVLQWWPIDGASSPYAASYNQDVRYYGRGYDSTVWMKTMDSVTHKQKYVMIAELNTVVPNFYLVSDPPTATPLAPYFDNQSTKLDYYLHMPSTWGTRIQNVALGSDYASLRDSARQLIESVPTGTAPAVDSTFSDEKITYYESVWSESTRSWTRQPSLNNIDGDIYFNLAGFSPLTNTIDNSTINSVNYSFGSSGNLYDIGGDRVAAVDQMLWHIRLPAIGNTIAQVWNTLYTEGRKVAFLDENYNNEPYCTIGTQSVLGVVNNAQEVVGGIYTVNGAADFANAAATSSSIITAGGQISETLYNIMKARNKSFISRTIDDTQYYYLPTYAAIFTQVDRDDITNQDIVYKLDADGIYRKTHKDLEDIATTLYSRQEENEIRHFPYIRFKKVTERAVAGSTPYSGSALRIANEELNGIPTTLMGAIAYTNKLLGTQLDLENSRDERTVIGLMNRMRDMINNIDTHLVPNRLVYVSNTGKLVTSNYVYTEPESNKVLIGASGAVNWVNSSALPLGTYTPSQDVQMPFISNGDNIGGALAKLEARILTEESVRSNAVSTINSNLETAIAQEGRDRTAAINSATIAITGLSQQPAEGAIAQYVTSAIAAAEQRINAATQSAINDAFEGDEVDINETFVRSVIGTELTDAQPNADPPVSAGLIMSAINTKVNAEATARDSAIAARFNSELDENGSSNNLIHILQGYVNTETTARADADSALSGRVTTLETRVPQAVTSIISNECGANGIIDTAIANALRNQTGSGSSGEFTAQDIRDIADARITAACGTGGDIRNLIIALINSALSDYLTISAASDQYQLKGDYLTSTAAAADYQPKGNYAAASDVTTITNQLNSCATLSYLDTNYYSKDDMGDLRYYVKTEQLKQDETGSDLLETILNNYATNSALGALNTTVSGIDTTVSGHTTSIASLNGTVSSHTASIDALDRRVTALEPQSDPGE